MEHGLFRKSLKGYFKRLDLIVMCFFRIAFAFEQRKAVEWTHFTLKSLN